MVAFTSRRILWQHHRQGALDDGPGGVGARTRSQAGIVPTQEESSGVWGTLPYKAWKDPEVTQSRFVPAGYIGALRAILFRTYVKNQSVKCHIRRGGVEQC